MPKNYCIELESRDLGQLLDGLQVRAESWERTAEYLRTEAMPAGGLFFVEECGRPEEADDIAEHYRSIIRRIQNQMEAQS